MISLLLRFKFHSLKKLFLVLFIFPVFTDAQDFVDLLSIGYGHSFKNDFENTPGSTNVEALDVDLTIPFVINDKYTFVTGPIFNRNRFQLFPGSNPITVYSTLLKLGLIINHSEKWTSSLVALPKLASDYKNISSNDLQYGGIAIFSYKKSENLVYKFGAYGSTEAFGFVTTPFFGWYYLGPNKRFSMDVLLPISADVNYAFNKFSIGFDYIGVGRSYNVNENDANLYADQGSLKATAYIQTKVLNKNILLRAKFGHASNNYEAYQQGQRIGLRLPGFDINDNRNQLNPDIQSSFLFEFEAIYRLKIPPKKKK